MTPRSLAMFTLYVLTLGGWYPVGNVCSSSRKRAVTVFGTLGEIEAGKVWKVRRNDFWVGGHNA